MQWTTPPTVITNYTNYDIVNKNLISNVSYSIQNTITGSSAIFTSTAHLLSDTANTATTINTISNVFVNDTTGNITRPVGSNIYTINNAGIVVLSVTTNIYITIRYIYTGGAITATSNLRLVRIG